MTFGHFLQQEFAERKNLTQGSGCVLRLTGE